MPECKPDPAHVSIYRRFLKSVTCLAAILMAAHLHSAGLLGEVVGIADGDTVTVLDADKVQHRIRLQGIDAPEKKQAFGQRSKASLSDLVFRQPVRVDWEKRDRYKRIIGKVWVASPDSPCRGAATCPMALDASLEQLRVGMAWWYRRYAGEQGAADRARYEDAEREVRERRGGLWRDQAPIAPWDWRRR